MLEHDSFLGLAEVAIVLAGFSGISVVLSRRGPDALSQLDAGRIATLVESSLAVALFALLPLALSGLGARGSVLWTICSGSLAIYLASLSIRVAITTSRLYRDAPDERDRPVWVVVSFGGALVAVVIQCLNVFAVGFGRTSGPYVFGIVLCLALNSRLFVRSLSILRSPLPDARK